MDEAGCVGGVGGSPLGQHIHRLSQAELHTKLTGFLHTPSDYFYIDIYIHCVSNLINVLNFSYSNNTTSSTVRSTLFVGIRMQK